MVIDEFPMAVGEPFEAEWQVDQHGYEAIYPTAEERERPRRLIEGDPSPRIVRNGGPLRAYRPFQDHPGLFLEFGNCEETPEAAAAFATKYGLLGAYSFDLEVPNDEDFSLWLNSIRNMRRMVGEIEARIQNDEPLADLAALFEQSVRPWFTIGIDIRAGRKPRPVVVPRTLIGVMWLQVLGQITSGLRFRQCKACPSWFRYGPGTGHRSTREFCSNRCRVAWNRAQKAARR